MAAQDVKLFFVAYEIMSDGDGEVSALVLILLGALRRGMDVRNELQAAGIVKMDERPSKNQKVMALQVEYEKLRDFDDLYEKSNKFTLECVENWPQKGESPRRTIDCFNNTFDGSKLFDLRNALLRLYPRLREFDHSVSNNVIHNYLSEHEILKLHVTNIYKWPTNGDGNCGYHGMLQIIVETYAVNLIAKKRSNSVSCSGEQEKNKCLSRMEASIATLGFNKFLLIEKAIQNRQKGYITWDRHIINQLRTIMLVLFGTPQTKEELEQYKEIYLGITDDKISHNAWLSQSTAMHIVDKFGLSVTCVNSIPDNSVDNNPHPFIVKLETSCVRDQRENAHMAFLSTDGTHFTYAEPNNSLGQELHDSYIESINNALLQAIQKRPTAAGGADPSQSSLQPPVPLPMPVSLPYDASNQTPKGPLKWLYGVKNGTMESAIRGSGLCIIHALFMGYIQASGILNIRTPSDAVQIFRRHVSTSTNSLLDMQLFDWTDETTRKSSKTAWLAKLGWTNPQRISVDSIQTVRDYLLNVVLHWPSQISFQEEYLDTEMSLFAAFFDVKITYGQDRSKPNYIGSGTYEVFICSNGGHYELFLREPPSEAVRAYQKQSFEGFKGAVPQLQQNCIIDLSKAVGMHENPLLRNLFKKTENGAIANPVQLNTKTEELKNYATNASQT